MEFNVEHGKKQYLLPFAHAGQVLTEQASDVAKAEHLKSKTILESAKNSQGRMWFGETNYAKLS